MLPCLSCYGLKLVVIEKVRNYGKIVFPTSPLDPPLPTLITMSLTTSPPSRFGFSMMCGKFCYSCFEITARTALAQFRHFTLKRRFRFQKGEGRPLKSLPWVRHWLTRSGKLDFLTILLQYGVVKKTWFGISKKWFPHLWQMGQK